MLTLRIIAIFTPFLGTPPLVDYCDARGSQDRDPYYQEWRSRNCPDEIKQPEERRSSRFPIKSKTP